MRRLLPRTSITIDEAVSMLLGRTTGPIDLEPLDETEDAERNAPLFCLRDDLEDEMEVLAGELDLAKHEKQSAEVIAEKLAAVNRHEVVMVQADVCRCAIDDELNKGEQSMLRVDVKRTNTAYTYITLHSFNEWQKQQKNRAEPKPDRGEPAPDPAPAGDLGGKRPRKLRDKMRRQERAILDAIAKLGHEPKALPKHTPEAGVKADVWQVVQASGLFNNYDIYDKAWYRLRRVGDIRDR